MKGSDNHLDVSMDDTSSLPTTNIINLNCDRSKFYFNKQINKRKDLQKSRITEINSTKNQIQAIKNNCL